MEFGSNPGRLRMFQYLPESWERGRIEGSAMRVEKPVDAPGDAALREPGPALVVALHGCMQDAAELGENSGWIDLAERWGFLLLLPEQRRRNNLTGCFNWFSPEDARRDTGEALSIRQMIDQMQRNHGVDSRRVYVTGISAGAAMALVLMSAYPEVISGGAPLAGVPVGCADGMLAGLSCMSDPPQKDAADWGAAVLSAADHPGPWPRVSVWQGEADSAVDPGNALAIVQQWTHVHGIEDATPEPAHAGEGHSHRVYRDSSGRILVESHLIEGMGHGIPVDPGQGARRCGKESKFFPDVGVCSSLHIARFWGLRPGHPD
jgi:poly(hydroxyalkanoate) depolymerase family esterase